MRIRGLWAVVMLGVMAVLWGCGDTANSTPQDEHASDAISSPHDSTTEMDSATPADPADAQGDLDTAESTSSDVMDSVDEDIDTAEPSEPALPTLVTRAPLTKPEDPLADSSVQSCATYLEERCVAGALSRCDLYDPANEAYVDDPPALLHRAMLFDRWRDLYNSPDGQAIDRDFLSPTLAGTPESDWGSLDNFKCYCGAGDGGIWTGWSVVSAILRYSETGTRAEYERMEEQVRQLLTMWEVTEIPGYLSRYHYLRFEEGAPKTDQHITRTAGVDTFDHKDRSFDASKVKDIASTYRDGLIAEDGTVWPGQPMWHGRPSIDQNTGPVVAFPMAYALLEDEDLKARMAYQLTCYLKRLERVEIINLDQQPDAVDTLLTYFAGANMDLDPGDIDFSSMTRVVMYVHRQINSLNEDSFDTSCPDDVQMTPWRVLDGTDDTFIFDVIELALDLDAHNVERAQGINHMYVPTLRGGDAMHMMNLATIAYHLTGDDRYRQFLFEELIGELHADQVAFTAGAFKPPTWCKNWYGDHITYGPWWGMLQLLDDSPLRTQMQQAFHEEMWAKVTRFAGNADFEIMYAGEVPPDIADPLPELQDKALAALAEMGGNGGVLDDPRRAYARSADEVVAELPESWGLRCPTEEERTHCEADIDIFGYAYPGESISHDCTGAQTECVMADGQCTWAVSEAPLPVQQRRYTDYLWQRDPFMLGRGAHMEGWRQYAGTDYTQPYWNARRYGMLSEGKGLVLAWRADGPCSPASSKDQSAP